jgi:signal transduction histidine kinase/ligand-binding sensor domain-containing protein/AraC-like DNA-binding protein
MPKRATLIVLLQFFWISLSASPNCTFEHLSTSDGLSHGSVSAMIKDSRGFMWFATWDGINRYDGHTFKTFKPGKDKPVSNRIEKIKEDAYGNIWVVTYDSKAFRLNRQSEIFDPVPALSDSLSALAIQSISILPTGDVWLLTNTHGTLQIITDTLTNQFNTIDHHTESEASLPGNSVYSVNRDNTGKIWINTDEGLACYLQNKKNGIEPEALPEGIKKLLKKYSITVLHDTPSNLFMGTSEGSLLIFNHLNNNLVNFTFNNTHSISHISGNNHKLFLGTKGNGLFFFDTFTNKINQHYKQNEINFVLKTYPDTHGMLWIESSLPGISKIDTQTGAFKHYEQKLSVPSDIRSNAQCGIMEDDQNIVWLTLKGGGFGYYNHKTDEVEYFYNEPENPKSKVSNFVNCFYKYNDVLWMSTYFKGIEKVTFIDEHFRHIQPAPQSNLSIANEVRAIMEDSRGFLWVATKDQTLYILNEKAETVKTIKKLNDKPIGRIYTMTETSNGTIYLGTKGNGLFTLKREGNNNFDTKHYTHNENDHYSISNNNIYTIVEDRNHQIWIGTYGGGVNLLKKEQFIHFKNEMTNYPANHALKVRNIATASNGDLWIGTTEGLLTMKTDSSSTINFTLFNHENNNTNGLQGNDIFCIVCDRNGDMWLSSMGGGLAKVLNDPSKNNVLECETFTRNNGLPSDMVFTIIPDSKGRLWMSTENGIAAFNPSNNHFSTYEQYDGMRTPGFSEGAATQRSDGSICMGANNGMYLFYPASFVNSATKTDILFTGFSLFGKEVLPGEKSPLKKSITETQNVKITHNQNVFGITWAALDFKRQDKFQFEYMLEGYDNEWRFARAGNMAGYTRVPPGNYTFKVRFASPAITETNEVKTLAIYISPPLWKTKWAYIIYLLLAIIAVEMARRIITTMIQLRNNVVIEREITNAKLDFFTNISHELRTPITLILGPTKELATKEQLTEKGKSYTSIINQNALRLLKMVNQLLDLRKIQHHKMELSLTNVDIQDIVSETFNNFKQAAFDKNIHFVLKQTSKNLKANIDREKFVSVLFNLLSNALKFTNDNGKIEVNTQEYSKNHSVNIEICDKGTGITKEEEETLFKAFASRPSGNNQPGTGIGLALSKELMHLHKGDISYRPTPGGGATFTITLPLSKTPITATETRQMSPSGRPAAMQTKASTSKQPSHPLLLIVEDNTDLLQFLSLQLGDHYRVETAKNGIEGFEKALLLQPDLILSDVMMPEMDGIEMLDKLKNNFETSHIPIVLLTAKASVESKIEGLKYGADAYLTKPFNSKQLSAQLNNLLLQRNRLREAFSGAEKRPTVGNKLSITDEDAHFLNLVRSIIEENIEIPAFKTSVFYTQTGMGRSKFYNKLKGLTGLSPVDFIREIRLNKAHEMLQNGRYNVSETASLNGFSDAAYFSRCFKEKFGMPPSKIIR